MDDLIRLLPQHLPQVPAWVHELHINPWAVAIGAGLIAAFLEQRLMHRDAPPFTTAHRGSAAAAKPTKPRRRRLI